MTLLEHHRKMVEASAIAPEVIERRGYRSVTEPEELVAIGFAAKQIRVPALLVPVYGAGGIPVLHQHRPDNPRELGGRIIKYETPTGAAMHLDLPPGTVDRLRDPKVTLWITEGVRKVDSLVTAGVAAVGLLGVDCWRGKNEAGGKTALADWAEVALQGREVVIVYDSDAATKKEVLGAEQRLAAWLASRGAMVSIARIPPGPDGAKVGIDDYLAAGGKLADLPLHPAGVLPTGKRKAPPADGRPEITVGPDLPAIVRGSIEALVRRGGVYVRAGVLVEPGVLEPNPGGTVRRDPQALVAVPLSRGRMREVLAEAAAFYGVTRDGERYPIQPPPILARELLERGRYEGIPRLEVIASGPYIRDGRLIASPGFDPESGTLAVFDPRTFPEIPLRPTAAEVREAARIFQEWMTDIAFATEADRTAAIACLVESVVGPSIDGPRPVRCVEASTAGSGKGLFADCCELIGTGVGPAVTAYAEDEELRKTLLGLAVQGDQSVLFDNVSGRFGSPILAAAITGRAIKGRLLGGNAIVSAPLRIGWWMTGNNPSFGHDLGRRVLPTRLDPGCMHPEDRSGFKFPNLVEHVRQHRGRYYSAVLVLALAYVQAGRPAHGLARWGSFERWDDAVRGPMIWAGLGDPLAVRLRLREKADEDLNHLRRLHEVWAGRFPAGGTVRDALTRASAGDGDLQDVLAALDERSPGSPSPVRVGRALHRIAGRIIDTYREGRLVSRRRMVDPPGHGGLVVWRVEDLLPRGGDGGDGGVISPYLRPSTETSLPCSGVELTPPPHPTQPAADRNGHPPLADGEDDPEREAIRLDGAP